MQPSEPGDPHVIGPFRVLGRLGEGGMGVVHLGRDGAGRLAAVKTIRDEHVRAPAFRERFTREVAAARRVEGPRTARLLDADTDGPMPWLATAYVPGLSLQDVVDGFGPLPEASLRVLAAGLADALAVIHAAGLVHRDLKPSNVLLTGDGPLVIDFGIAFDTATTRLTTVGTAVGTVDYMSPEQARGEAVGPASDVFSLGGVLAFAAGCGTPFGSGSLFAVLNGIQHAEPRVGEVPRALRPLVRQCLAKQPHARPDPAGVRLMATDDGSSGEPGPEWLPAPVMFELLRLATTALGADPDGAGIPAAERGTEVVVPGQRAWDTRLGPGGPRVPPSAESLAAARGRVLAVLRARQAQLAASERTRVAERRSVPGTRKEVRPAGRRGVPGARRAGGAGRRGDVPPGSGTAWDTPVDPSSPPGRSGTSRRAVLAALVAMASPVGIWLATGGLDRRSRRLLPPSWQADLGSEGRRVAVENGVVVACALEAVSAYDLLTGRRLWAVEIPDARVRVIGDTAYTGGEDGTVRRLDLATGAERWRFQAGDEITVDPAADGDAVYVHSADGNLYAVDAARGTRLWRTALGDPDGLVLTGGGLYVYGYEDARLDRATGARTDWEPPGVDLVAGGVGFGADSESPRYGAFDLRTGRWRWTVDERDARALAATGDLVLLDREGRGTLSWTSLLALSASTGEQQWQKVLSSRVEGAALEGNALYVITEDDVMRIDARVGNVVWTADLGGSSAPPVIAGERVLLIRESRVYALDGAGPVWSD